MIPVQMPTETKETKETNGVEFFTANSDDDDETTAPSPPATNRPTRILVDRLENNCTLSKSFESHSS